MNGDAAVQSGASTSGSRERYRAIPEELRHLRRWGLRKAGKTYAVVGNELVQLSGSWQELARWMAFEDALAAIEKYGADGLTFFAFPQLMDDPEPVLLYIENCRDPTTGEISQWARSRIERLQPFYVEVSVTECDLTCFVIARYICDSKQARAINGEPAEFVQSIASYREVDQKQVAQRAIAILSDNPCELTGVAVDDLCSPARDMTAEFCTTFGLSLPA
ncbi:MAG: hypothetical protein N3G75_08255, partial [Methanothrix sp.]